MGSFDRASAALALATAAFVSMPLVLTAGPARAQDAGRRVPRRIDGGGPASVARREEIDSDRVCEPGDVRPACITARVTVVSVSNSVGDEIGMGTIVGGGDPFFANAPNRLSGYGVGATFSYRTRDWRHALSLNFSRTEGSTHAVTAVGQEVGFLPGDSTDPGKTLGVDSGFATSNVDLDIFAATYRIRPRSGGGFFNGAFGDRLGFQVSVRGSSLDHRGHMARSADPDVTFFDVDQDLRSYEIGFGPTISGKLDLTSRLYLWGSADLELVLRHSTLESDEICTPCDTGDTFRIEDDKTSVDVRASVDGAVGFALTPQIDIKLIGGFVLAGRDTIDVRHQEDDPDTHIDRHFAADYHGGLRVQWDF